MPTIFFYGPQLDDEKKKELISSFTETASRLTGIDKSLVKVAVEATEGSGNDLANLLLELWAYVGDILSYYQDKIADEAYLGTASRRRSLACHARLIDYNIHPGLSSYLCLVEKMLRQIRGNLKDLYNDHFIESPDDWTVPYMEMCSAIADVEKRLLALASQLAENDKDEGEDED